MRVQVRILAAALCLALFAGTTMMGQDGKNRAMVGGTTRVGGQGHIAGGLNGQGGNPAGIAHFDSGAWSTAMIQQFDKDGDGALNHAELQACLELLHRQVTEQLAAAMNSGQTVGWGQAMSSARTTGPGMMMPAPFVEMGRMPGMSSQSSSDSNSQFNQSSDRMSRSSSAGQRSFSSGSRK